MEKQVRYALSGTVYLLGKDEDGILYWLKEPSWDCGWYWGFGYVETYTNNARPDLARDITSHQHFNRMFLQGQKCSHDTFKDFFKETPLSDDEIWQLCDYMLSFYTLKDAADLFSRGYSYQTERAKIDLLKDKAEEDRLNKVLLPELFGKVKELLSK